MKFTAKVKDGSLTFHDYQSLKKYLNGVKGEVWVDIKEAPKSVLLSKMAIIGLY